MDKILEKLLEKLSGVLTESDLAEIKTELVTLTESVSKEKDKLELILEQEAKTKYETLLESEKVRLEGDYNNKIVELEEHLTEQLDLYIRTEMEDAITPEIFSKVALNETLQPIVEGIMDLFKTKFVSLDTEAATVVASKTEEADKLKAQLTESVEKHMETKKLLEEAYREKLLIEKTKDLSPAATDKVKILVEGKDFEWLKKKIDAVVEIAEADSKKSVVPRETTLTENYDPVNSGEKGIESKPVIKPEVKKDDLFESLTKAAGAYL